MEENIPDTQPDGPPAPPPPTPPVALAASAPMPPRPPASRTSWRTDALRDLAAAALDRLDILGDRIANVVGLR
jgi:hypothetical protein